MIKSQPSSYTDLIETIISTIESPDYPHSTKSDLQPLKPKSYTIKETKSTSRIVPKYIPCIYDIIFTIIDNKIHEGKVYGINENEEGKLECRIKHSNGQFDNILNSRIFKSQNDVLNYLKNNTIKLTNK
jgi:hypothetical protein